MKCHDMEVCAFSKDVKILNISGLESGLLYNFSFKTAKEKEQNISYAVSKNICQTFSLYTAPELPKDITIPTERINSSSFVVQFSDHQALNNFIDWHLDVYNNGEFITNMTQPKAISMMTISEGIQESTTYTVSIFTVALNQTSISENVTVNTRPIDTSPAQFYNVSENSIFLHFNCVDPTTKYTHIVTTTCQINFGGPCKPHGSNGTFERCTKPVEVKISDLKPGTLYTVTIHTSFKGMLNSVPQTISSYTTPNIVNKTSIKIASSTTSSMRVMWGNVTETFNGYNVHFNCTSPNINSKSNATFDPTVYSNEASVSGLDPGTFCSINLTTFLKTGEFGNLFSGVVEVRLNESTNETAPGSVQSAQISETTSMRSTLHWSTPFLRNGIIRHYVTWITEQNDSCLRLSLWNFSAYDDLYPINANLLRNISCSYNETNTFSSETQLSWSLTGLHPFRNYTAYIAAYTVDLGPQTTVQIDTLEDIPGKPVSLRDEEKTSNSIKMHWSAPLERNGIVLNYTVKYRFDERECRKKGAIKEVSKTSETSLTQMELTESIYSYWDYNISVKATNKIDSGNYSDVYSVKTNESNPDTVNEITSEFVFAQNATIIWKAPCYANGVLRHFYVEITNETTRDNKSAWKYTAKVNATLHELVVHQLLPFRNYSVKIFAENTYYNGTYNASHEFRTAIDDPEKTTGLSQNLTFPYSVKLSWDRVKKYTGPTKYIINVVDLSTHELFTTFNTTVGYWLNELATEALIVELDAYWHYTVSVTAVTSDGDMSTRYSATSELQVLTAEDVPGPVTNLTVQNETDLEKPRQLVVRWERPKERDLNGIIVRYYIFCSNMDKLYNTTSSVQFYKIPLFINNTVDIAVQVWAATRAGNGTPTDNVIAVSPGAPYRAIETPTTPLTKTADVPVDDNKKMIAVLLPKTFLCNNANGLPDTWGVIVAQDGTENEIPFVGSREKYNNRSTSDYKKWYQVKDDDKMWPYIATSNWTPQCNTEHKTRRRRSVEDNTINFIVGSDDCSNNKGYCNGPLQPGRSYRVKSFACTTTGCTETLYSHPIQTAPNLVPAIVGGLAAAVAVIAVVTLIVYTKRTGKLCFSRKTVEREQKGGDIEIPEVETPSTEYIFKPGPVRLSEFSEYVARMHRDSKMLFSDAFKMLRDKSPGHPITAADTQQCRPKNRYTNIMPFDHSRVKLRALDDVEGSDFINANYIPGNNSRREYIATQGPMQMTFDDFWRMIWEQNVDAIVMLTKLAEKGRIKCDQYWPNATEPVFYGEVVVSIKSESNLSDYTLRIFEIKTSKGPSRIVKQFWYLKWPDMGCPEDPQMLLDFVKSVREHTHRPDRTNPTVVHCSAGVGRTGTFIAVDHLLQYIRNHDTVNIYQLVLDMREHRVNMVQTEDQFIYIYECLKAFINTDEEDEEPIYQNGDFGAENIYENAGFRKET
ncbi:receptor-type tyrosine-protein phosphatase F-like [Dreissena polymorpha]|nr:receptor-type tyrosine-protein phosphatase F-like [Dreissena polymorpha]